MYELKVTVQGLAQDGRSVGYLGIVLQVTLAANQVGYGRIVGIDQPFQRIQNRFGHIVNVQFRSVKQVRNRYRHGSVNRLLTLPKRGGGIMHFLRPLSDQLPTAGLL